MNLLSRLQTDLTIAYLFITHDLSVVRDVSEEIAVMYLGRVVESGPADTVCTAPSHPYTQALLSAAPQIRAGDGARRDRIILHGDVPSPINPPSGCRFRTRCPYVMDICSREDPPPVLTPNGATVCCHLHDNVAASGSR